MSACSVPSLPGSVLNAITGLKGAAAIAAFAALMQSGGCDKAHEYGKDADRGANNDAPADTMTFPDGFNNVATKCDGPNRVYVTFHGDGAYGSIAVVTDDPRCVR